MKTLVCGDLHMKDTLGYADFVADGRKGEKKEVLDFIHDLSKDCDRVVFLGDQLNGRNNSSEVIKEFVRYIERFTKEVYIIAGNHEKTGDGKSAIDFLKEINNKRWHIITDEVAKIGEDVYCPYFYKGELECNSHKEATDKLMTMLPDGDNLFVHHATSGYVLKNINTDNLNEIVLPKKALEKKFNKIFCGHIHQPSNKAKDKILYAGSIFTNEVNEGKKYVFTMEDGVITEHELPVREIVRVENPTIKELEAFAPNTILKVILSETISVKKLEEMTAILSKFDGSIMVEDFKTERKVVKFNDGELDLNIDNLIKIYAEDRKVDLKKLQDGYELIK